MKPSSILNFLPKIHHPLPRTPRQSKKLLAALTSSFRRQLDREYPPTPAVPASDRDDHATHPPPPNPDSSLHATDKHMKAILDNPLFRVPPARVQPQKSRLPRDPMASFDGLAAAGLVDPPFIAECLRSQLAFPRKSSSGNLRESMEASKAGSKVVSWWWSANAQGRKQLFLTQGLTRTLLKFMVVERLQDAIMQWLKMLAKRDLGGHNGQVSERFAFSALRQLLVDLIGAEKHFGKGLSSATDAYVRACKMLLSMSDPPCTAQLMSSMRGPGVRLGHWIVQSDQSKEIPVSLFEDYMALLSASSSARPIRWPAASLPLYHPTHPNPRPLLDFAKSLQPGEPDAWDDEKRRDFFTAGFEALRVLTEQEALRDASDLAGHMQQLLPKEPREMSPKPSTQEDDLLESLEWNPT